MEAFKGNRSNKQASARMRNIWGSRGFHLSLGWFVFVICVFGLLVGGVQKCRDKVKVRRCVLRGLRFLLLLLLWSSCCVARKNTKLKSEDLHRTFRSSHVIFSCVALMSDPGSHGCSNMFCFVSKRDPALPIQSLHISCGEVLVNSSRNSWHTPGTLLRCTGVAGNWGW